jgi:suppressor for copper-sensitivity B
MTAVTERSRRLALLVAAACLAWIGTSELNAQRPRLERAELSLAVDRSSYAAGDTARIAARLVVEPGWHVQSNTPTFDYLIPTELSLTAPPGWLVGDVTYPRHTMWTAEFEDEPLAVYEGEVLLFAELAVPSEARGTATVEATVRYQACDDRQCLPPIDATASLELPIGNTGRPTNAAIFTPGESAPRATASTGLLGILAVGLLGGLILNAMPCVLPVLSLKLLGLLHHAGQHKRVVVAGSLATAAGIVVSFWALAGLAILARSAGELIGWGVQFQNPTFVTFLTLVVLLFCLNLWGLFEVPLPARLASYGDGGHEGIAGHFVTGLFATLMATPCSAPFLGTAVGFGLAQSGGVILAVFTAIGIGMSLPYLALAAFPSSTSWLPKPGIWMLKLKVVMGFLLAGAAVWLLYVLASQVSGERLAFIQGGLLLVSLFVWLTHASREVGLGRALARVGVVAGILLTLALSAGGGPAPSAGTTEIASLIQWTDFDRREAEALAQEGRLVFVDVTADWCFTCKANERLVLETTPVADAFERHGVVAMRADWTNRDEEIAQFLADFGRYSIPFYMLYQPGAEPHLFSEILRRDDILEALRAGDAARTVSLPASP